MLYVWRRKLQYAVNGNEYDTIVMSCIRKPFNCTASSGSSSRYFKADLSIDLYDLPKNKQYWLGKNLFSFSV